MLADVEVEFVRRQFDSEFPFGKRPPEQKEHEVLISVLLGHKSEEKVSFHRVELVVFNRSHEVYRQLVRLALSLDLEQDILCRGLLQCVDRHTFNLFGCVCLIYALGVELEAVNLLNHPHQLFDVHSFGSDYGWIYWLYNLEKFSVLLEAIGWQLSIAWSRTGCLLNHLSLRRSLL